jgi:hypothetical protein
MNLAKIVYARYGKTLKYFTGTPKKSLVKMVSWKKIADEVSSKDKMQEKIEWLANIMGDDDSQIQQMRLNLDL